MQLDHQYDNANHATVLLDNQQEAPISVRSQIKVKMGVKIHMILIIYSKVDSSFSALSITSQM
jgi:hypothetical protein